MANINNLEEKLYELDYTQSEIEQMLPKLEKIIALKKQKNALILAHYYQIPPIQLIADAVGDSLALAVSAKTMTKNKSLILSSTVYFMAEMVKLINPDKKVIISDQDASCSIAEGINKETIIKIREHYPNAAIVGYINTTADVKAEIDVSCTSANASKIIKKIPNKTIIMLPDYFFAKNIFADIIKNKTITDKILIAYKGIENSNIVLENEKTNEQYLISADKLPLRNKGTCIVHEKFTPEEILYHKEKNQIDLVLAHPEINPRLTSYIDMVGGTKKMIDYLKQKPLAKRILFITECDMAASLRLAFPEKEFITPCKFCDYMKRNSLDKIISSLKEEKYQISIPENIQQKAYKSITRMFEIIGEN